MADTNNKRRIVICGKGGGMSTVTWDDIQDKPEFATVATSGDYDDLTDKPTILTQWFGTQAEYDAIAEKDPNTVYNIEGSDNVQPDWNQNDTTADDYIKNKPTIPAAQVNSDWNAASGVAQILNKPTLATVATSGDYNDLSNKPTIPAAPVQSNWNESDSTSLAYIQNKPTIPAAPVQSDWNEADNTSLAYIANKPSIPAAQVNSDWNANSGVAQILNKPIIPVVPAYTTETLTFTLQGGTVKTIEFYTKPMSANYFYVEDVSGAANTLTIAKVESFAPTIEVFCSTDQQNWTSMGTTSDTTPITATIPAYGRLYLKATANVWGESMSDNTITASGSHSVGGNIMSLLYGDNFVNQTTFPTGSSGNFENLFNFNATLVSAANLVLPATTLTNNCYYNMFNSCVSLTQAPALPATTLAEQCYYGMFAYCGSLTTAPELPATTLTQNCYDSMFMECSSLNSVTTYAQDISATNCLTAWVAMVSGTGDFYNLGGATYTSGESGIPSGWIEHNSL